MTREALIGFLIAFVVALVFALVLFAAEVGWHP